MDKKVAAEKIRARLEKRLASILGCEPNELPRMKLGTLVHTAFLLWGDGEELGGFHTSMGAVLQLVGHEIAWDSEPKVEEAETPKVVIKLIRELTLDQMGKEINAAIQTLTLAQRKAIKEWLLSELRKPVGL